MLPRCRVLVIFCLSIVLSFSGALELISMYKILVPFHLQPAVCTIKAAQPLAQYMSLANHCNPAHHGEDWKAMCGFWSVTPGWQAEVTLLSQYTEVEVRSSVDDVRAGLEEPHADTASTTPLRRHALHDAHTRPWNAIAIPPLHSESASARKRHGLVTKGACSGQTLLGREDTIDMCLHRRAEWMPMVTMNSTCVLPALDPNTSGLSLSALTCPFSLLAQRSWDRGPPPQTPAMSSATEMYAGQLSTRSALSPNGQPQCELQTTLTERCAVRVVVSPSPMSGWRQPFSLYRWPSPS